MNTFLIIMACLLWYTVGVISYIGYWVLKFDFKTSDIGFTLLMGIFGPINSVLFLIFYIGYIFNKIINKSYKNKILIKKVRNPYYDDTSL